MHKHPHVFQQACVYGNELLHPSASNVHFMFDVFAKRIDPLTKIIFKWDLEAFKQKALDINCHQSLSNDENAFLQSLYLVVIRVLTEAECNKVLGSNRTDLLSKHQAMCEQALLNTQIFCMTTITIIRAVTLYMVCFRQSICMKLTKFRQQALIESIRTACGR